MFPACFGYSRTFGCPNAFSFFLLCEKNWDKHPRKQWTKALSCVQNKQKYFLHSFRSIYKENKKRKKKYSRRTGMWKIWKDQNVSKMPALHLSPSQYRTWLLLEGVCMHMLQERVCYLSHRVICKRVEKQERNQKKNIKWGLASWEKRRKSKNAGQRSQSWQYEFCAWWRTRWYFQWQY